jgi:hypothetical protein
LGSESHRSWGVESGADRGSELGCSFVLKVLALCDQELGSWCSRAVSRGAFGELVDVATGDVAASLAASLAEGPVGAGEGVDAVVVGA